MRKGEFCSKVHILVSRKNGRPSDHFHLKGIQPFEYQDHIQGYQPKEEYSLGYEVEQSGNVQLNALAKILPNSTACNAYKITSNC